LAHQVIVICVHLYYVCVFPLTPQVIQLKVAKKQITEHYFVYEELYVLESY